MGFLSTPYLQSYREHPPALFRELHKHKILFLIGLFGPVIV